jgi:hypothetical protein
MLSTCGAWLERQRILGHAPWTALLVHKVYIGEEQRKQPGAQQIELLLNGSNCRWRSSWPASWLRCSTIPPCRRMPA